MVFQQHNNPVALIQLRNQKEGNSTAAGSHLYLLFTEHKKTGGTEKDAKTVFDPPQRVKILLHLSGRS